MTRTFVRNLAVGALLAAATVFRPASVVAQQPAAATTGGTITGRVVDQGNQQPLADVQVRVVGTTRGTITGADGRYRLVNVPAGSVQLRTQRIGFQPQTRTVTVAAGQTATADFALAAGATTLEQVTVTATGETQRKRESGNVVATIKPRTEELGAVNNFAGLVQGRAAGVTIQQSGGSTGQGARVRIRGANSVSLSNEPLLIIDGVRVNSGSESNSIGVGGQSPSRLNDLNPNDIENIEVLKGPAASGLYGTAAANGVIQITTKKGRAGRPRWAVYTEQGALEDPVEYPANFNSYRSPGLISAAPGTGATYCTLADRAGPQANWPNQCRLAVPAGSPAGTRGAPMTDSNFVSFNPLEDPRTTPFRTGQRQRYGLNITGGNETAQYYLSGDQEIEDGIYKVNELQRTNLRGNVRARLLSTLNADVSIGYVSSGLELPQNDNNNLGLVSNGILGQARFQNSPTDTRGGFLTANRDQLFALRTFQDIERFSSGVNMTFTPFSFLNVVGTVGYDVLNRHDNQVLPSNRLLNNINNQQGSRTSNRIQIYNYTANLSGTGTFNLTSDLVSTTTAGVQYLREDFNGTFGFGAILAPGAASLNATAGRFSVDETNLDNRTLGLLAQQQLAWRDKIFLIGAIRGDDNSAFGQDFGIIYQPSASLSYVVSEEGFFPTIPGLSSLRLRTSYGESSLRPGTRDAVRFFEPVAVTQNGDAAGFTIGGIGNPDLKPERVREYELGFDLGLFGSRANLEFTYFNKRSQDALIAVTLPSSAGVGASVFQNIGEVANTGTEALLNATFIDNDAIRFETTFNFATLANKLISSGGRPPIIFGLGGSSQQHREGFPLGAYWQPAFTFNDANGDGIIVDDEYTVGDTASFIGNILPKRTISVSPALTLFKNLRLSALVDHQGGYYQNNATTAFQCGFGTCRDLYERTTPLENARALAQWNGEPTDAPYMEKADFVRIREVSLSATVPQSFTRRYLRSNGATFTVSGRNLALFTDYTGFDPEINFAGQSNFGQADFLSQPPVRYVMFRLDLNF